MNLLGIDYGDKKIGIALSKDSWIKPLKVIKNISEKHVFKEVQDLIDENNINKVIVGLPRPFAGKKNERLSITEDFVKQLGEFLSIPVDISSEIFTTKMALRFSFTRKQIQNEDARAACFILENYLAKKK